MTKPVLRIDDVRIVWKPDDYDEEGNEQSSCEAVAEVSYPLNDKGDRRLEWLSSGGLYGIQINGPNDPYQAEVELEQLDQLRDHLRAFGVDVRNFATRFAPALQE